ncbi:MAG: 4Fe-4S binding protein [Phycisphaerales bacterium]|nr:MAG: 4Fe-4S binding protein [Phycisphaerales bacterium]
MLPEQHQPLRVGRVEPFPPGRRLRVPLRYHEGSTVEPTVRLGQSVRALDLLARSSAPPMSTYAPAAGVVTAIGRTPTSSGHVRIAVELAISGNRNGSLEEPRQPPARPSDSHGWAALCDNFSLVNTIDGRPLSSTFRDMSGKIVEHLIIRAMGAEPVETAAPAVLLEQGTTIIEAAELLAKALGAGHTWLAVGKNFEQGRRLLARITRGTRLTPVVLPARYPQANIHLLVASVCGRTVPVNQRPEEHSVCVVDTATLTALANAALYALPATTSTLTITGDALARTGDYRIPAGVTVGEVLESVGTTKPTGIVVSGGPLSGRAMPHPDVVIDETTTCLTVLARRTARAHDAQACLRCGWCGDACPVGLEPSALMSLAEQFAIDRAAELSPDACIGCGVCSYICPAHLDLTRAMLDLKRGHLSSMRSYA